MKEVALYVHIPFCKQKCFYCDFPSYGGKEELINDYINALVSELKSEGSKYKFRSLFIGGGTPSYLDVINLEKLLNTINELNFKEDAEKTIECNPGTLDKEKLKVLKEYNINRLSMGLQTTKDNLLKDIGRIHKFEDFRQNYLLARSMEFKNINVDLMFGLPNQNIADVNATMEEIISLNPEHISCYSLIIEEGTPFYKMEEKNLLKLPSEEEEREMYHLVKRKLKDNGYNQYEISNYAKDGKECFHNTVYWKCEDYLGVGVSASSYIDNKRIKNIDDINEYIEKIKKNEIVNEEVISNSVKYNMEEFMFMGLRMMEGISEEEFKLRFNINIDNVYGEVISNNIKKGLLERKSGKIYLSSKGVELSNIVMSEMLL